MQYQCVHVCVKVQLLVVGFMIIIRLYCTMHAYLSYVNYSLQSLQHIVQLIKQIMRQLQLAFSSRALQRLVAVLPDEGCSDQ